MLGERRREHDGSCGQGHSLVHGSFVSVGSQEGFMQEGAPGKQALVLRDWNSGIGEENSRIPCVPVAEEPQDL